MVNMASLLGINQSKSFFEKDVDLRILATDISSGSNPCLKKSARVDKCEDRSVLRKAKVCSFAAIQT